MYMNTEHPNFDLDMEILCTIPLVPVSLKTLTRDVRVTYPKMALKQVHQIVIGLRKRYGYGDREWVRQGESGYEAYIPSDGWDAVCADCEDYWNRVYGDCPANAAMGFIHDRKTA